MSSANAAPSCGSRGRRRQIGPPAHNLLRARRRAASHAILARSRARGHGRWARCRHGRAKRAWWQAAEPLLMARANLPRAGVVSEAQRPRADAGAAFDAVGCPSSRRGPPWRDQRSLNPRPPSCHRRRSLWSRRVNRPDVEKSAIKRGIAGASAAPPVSAPAHRACRPGLAGPLVGRRRRARVVGRAFRCGARLDSVRARSAIGHYRWSHRQRGRRRCAARE